MSFIDNVKVTVNGKTIDFGTDLSKASAYLASESVKVANKKKTVQKQPTKSRKLTVDEKNEEIFNGRPAKLDIKIKPLKSRW